ncbi:hypothetical protein [uncultured Mycobacterium sp.]|uniref:hypothetical protein n=1 Tax=uncultured Mycobacterium sp. TaxID=171292 RepID=UPI0035CB252A
MPDGSHCSIRDQAKASAATGDVHRVGHHLTERGWADADVAAVLGGNFRRVAEQTWLSP